ncbi:MAG: tetratricopeptide repeat protein [Magnetococcales bacterium]|nr:tetratricopeptide repeat protein [Magnetococcales bacterium]
MILENSTWFHRLKPVRWFQGLSFFLAISCLGFILPSCSVIPSAANNTANKVQNDSQRPPYTEHDGDAFLNYILGQLYVMEQNWGEAEQAFSKVVKADKKAVDARVFVSHLAVQRGQVDQAISYTKEVIKLDPNRQKSRVLLASLFSAQKKYKEAAEQYELILVHDPDDSEVRLSAARTYGFLKKPYKAKKVLSPLFKNKKLAWKAYLTLGRVYASIPDLDSAVKVFYKSKELAPDKVQPVIALGILLQKQNKPNESATVYRDYLSDHPENKVIHSRLGRLLLNQNDRGGALEEFRAISNLAPDNIQARMTTSLILLSEYKYAEALQELRLAEATEPNNGTIKYYIAQALEFLNNSKQAEKTYHKVLAGTPFYPEAQLRLANIEATSNRTEKAIERIGKLVKQHPKKIIYLKALSLIQLRAEKYEDTIKTATRGLNINPDHNELRFNRAMAYDKLNMWPKAEKDLRVYIENNPKDAHALNYLGYTWAEKNIYLKEAHTLLQRAIRLAPDDGFVADSLGWVLYRLKNYKESLQRMQKAVLLEPKDPTIHEHLGDVLKALGKKQKALDVWEKALQLDPTNQKLMDKIKKNSQ